MRNIRGRIMKEKVAYNSTYYLKYLHKTCFLCAMYVAPRAFLWLVCFKPAMKPVTYFFFRHDRDFGNKVKQLKIICCIKFVWSYKINHDTADCAEENEVLFKQPPLWQNWNADFSESEQYIFQNDTTLTQDFSYVCLLNFWFVTIHDPDIILGTFYYFIKFILLDIGCD